MSIVGLLHSVCRELSRLARLLDGHDLLKRLKSCEPRRRQRQRRY